MALDNAFFIDQTGQSPKLLSVATATTAGGVYMAKLGSYMFSLDTAAFQSLVRDTQFRWASIQRVGNRSAHQFTGYDDETIELAGIIYPHFRGGIGQIELMRAEAGKGVPLALTYAFNRVGEYAGLWCIRSIRETRREFFSNGLPRAIEFSLSLVAYGETTQNKRATLKNPKTAKATPQTTTIAAPATLDTQHVPVTLTPSVEVTKNDNEISALGKFVGGVNKVNDLLKFADRMKSIAKTAHDIAKYKQVGLQRLIEGGLSPAVMSILPDSAKASAKVLFKTTGDIAGGYDEFANMTKVLQGNAGGLKQVGSSYSSGMLLNQAKVKQAGDALKSALSGLSGRQKDNTISDTDRIVAAATLRNAASIADDMTFTTGEHARQMAIVAGNITP